jgi:anti-anti-sigma factor
MIDFKSEVQSPRQDKVVRLRMQGDFDLGRAPRLHEALVRACRLEPTKLVVSMRQVTFVEAVNLGLLAGASARLRADRCSLVVEGATPWQQRLLNQCDLAHLLPGDSSFPRSVPQCQAGNGDSARTLGRQPTPHRKEAGV